MKQFTEQEIEDAKFATSLGVTIRQQARMLERKRNLTPDDILARIPEEKKERYIRGKALYEAGAHNW